MEKRKNKINDAPLTWKIPAYVIMIAFTIITIFPIIWLLYSSFKPHAEILASPLSLPSKPTISNYVNAWEIGNMGISIFNSIFYTSIATVCTLILAMAAAFGLTKFPYKSNGFFYGAFTGGLLITVHAVIVPLFLMESRIGIIDTRIGVILPYIAFDLPMSVLIAYSYVKSIPDALIEASLIDGANYFQIFFKIIFPCSKPVAATMVILSFLRHWNEFMFVFILTTGNDKRSLPVALNNFAGRLNVEYGMQFAALVISIIPMIIFYLIFHQQLIKGFGEGALKE
ncbi:carbohydrate ABC transporter permease [uncultured Brachyspira sp.]|uniref:carbohydrate ABC transporter permease n=1 Tax=uncultured Brachyspira sp. TaxID=221953 RepID=UPI0025D36BF6|nr:carbohydrate ABC transporter permease [uncultured Brachyspira sp.]